KWFSISIHSQSPNVDSTLRINIGIEQKSAIRRPVQRSFVLSACQQQFFASRTNCWFYVKVVRTLPVRSECDPAAVGRPDRTSIHRSVKSEVAEDIPSEIE